MSTKPSQLLQETSSLAEKMNDSSIDRMMAIDTDWNVIAWNNTAEQVTGISKSEIIGRKLLDALPQIKHNNELIQAIEKAFAGNKVFLPSDNNSYHRNYYENHFIPLTNPEGLVTGVMNIMHDVSHRIKAERHLQRLNHELQKKNMMLELANKDMAKFTYITTHDIKDPLRQVYTALELLMRKDAHSLSDNSKGNLRRMQSSLNRMNLLLDDIISVAGVSAEQNRFEKVSLNEVIKEVKTKLQRKLEESGAVIKHESLPTIMGHHHLLIQLLYQLIDNAIKFRSPNVRAEIQVEVSATELNLAPVTGLAEYKSYTRLSVTDNGIGLKEEEKERIFLMFEKLNDKQFSGSGIGLTVARKIMEAHDGVIVAETTAATGTTFHCYFPSRDNEA